MVFESDGKASVGGILLEGLLCR